MARMTKKIALIILGELVAACGKCRDEQAMEVLRSNIKEARPTVRPKRAVQQAKHKTWHVGTGYYNY